MRRIFAPAVFYLVTWLAVTWSVSPPDLALGVVVSLLVAIALMGIELDHVPLLLMPDRLLFALLYVPHLLWAIVRANLEVAYRVLHPALPIRPGIVKVRTKLTSEAGKVLLANSITLTPGTLSVDLVGDTIYVHRLYVPVEDGEARTGREIAGFEKRIRRIFE